MDQDIERNKYLIIANPDEAHAIQQQVLSNQEIINNANVASVRSENALTLGVDAEQAAKVTQAHHHERDAQVASRYINFIDDNIAFWEQFTQLMSLMNATSKTFRSKIEAAPD